MKTLLFCVAFALSASVTQAADPKLTLDTLKAALAKKPSGAQAALLARQVSDYFGADRLTKGNAEKENGLTVAWAIDAPGAIVPPQVVSSDDSFHLPLQRVGQTDTYAAVVTFPNVSGFPWHYVVNGQSKGGGNLEVYTIPDDDKPQPGVLQGKVTQLTPWQSKVFDGTTRDWWVYVPAEYTPDKPACVMVFQDGGGYKNYIPTVFDNLIAKHQMPVTVGIFLDPGKFIGGRSNRSFEYDTLSDQYSQFILTEILPEVEKTTVLRHDPQSRAIAGLSSGAICAWTVAWNHPDQFGKVLSWIGSYSDIAGGPSGIAGGHNYPFLIRRTPKKPIRIFLQDGTNDLDNQFGSWYLCNQQMARALAFAGYDYQFKVGHGFHSDKYGRVLLPASLRWLWRDWTP